MSSILRPGLRSILKGKDNLKFLNIYLLTQYTLTMTPFYFNILIKLALCLT